MASVTLVSGLCRSCRVHATFNKASVRGFSSSSPAWTSGGEDASRLLAQPALRSRPTSLAGSRSDPWDISRQMALPLAYPGSHPHDTSPRNWRSLMGLHGLRRVLFLAEVDSHPLKSQDLSSG
jgi:hypothetical protein